MIEAIQQMTIKSIMWMFVLPLFLIAYTTAWLIPATWWYEPGRIMISDTHVGGDPVVSINRTIHKGFDGRYSVSIWKDPPDGHMTCGGSDYLRYRGGLFEPHESPLTQWADDEWCGRLPAGKYYAEVCWTVLRPFFGIIPDKTVCTTSNMFSITSRKEIE